MRDELSYSRVDLSIQHLYDRQNYLILFIKADIGSADLIDIDWFIVLY